MKYIYQKHPTLSYRLLSAFVAFTFALGLIVPPVQAQSTGALQYAPTGLPLPGIMIPITNGFTPAIVRGITLHPDNPLRFDFIIDKGDTRIEGEELQTESKKLIKYFLASLTIPEEDLWVNLSPYEQDRIIPKGLGDTEMGRDLLTLDYLLKQFSASMMYPENELGEEFWDRVYAKAQEKYGTTSIPLNTFNKIWIVPEKAKAYEHDTGAFVLESYLKVMLEEDYVTLQENLEVEKYGLDSVAKGDAEVISSISSEAVREILIPEIEREVNEGKTFANLRQIYNSMILATWYKIKLKDSLLGKIYADQNKTKEIDTTDKQINQKIYDQYVESFKKGVYDYVKEDYDPATQQIIPRKYFSGGKTFFGLHKKVARSIVKGLTIGSLLLALLPSQFARADVTVTQNKIQEELSTNTVQVIVDLKNEKSSPKNVPIDDNYKEVIGENKDRLRAYLISDRIAEKFNMNENRKWILFRSLLFPKKEDDIIKKILELNDKESNFTPEQVKNIVAEAKEEMGSSPINEKKLGGQRRGGEFQEVFNGKARIQAGSFSYRIEITGNAIKFQRFDKNRNITLGKAHFIFLGMELSVGREHNNSYNIQDSKLSANHFTMKVSKEEGKEGYLLEIVDRESLNGTVVEWQTPIPKDMLVLDQRNFHEILKRPRLVAQGDIHGALDEFIINLQQAKLVDSKLNWIGGNNILVQMGDVIDRGLKSRESVEFLRRLQEEARKADGEVVRLLGNHELMLLQGDYRYANFENPQELANDLRTEIIEGRIKAAYVFENRLFIHGGMRSKIREGIIAEVEDIKGVSKEKVSLEDIAEKLNNILVEAIKKNNFKHAIFQVDARRGGRAEVAGIFWNDYVDLHQSQNANIINQVVAHTPEGVKGSKGQWTDSLKLINIDAGLFRGYGGNNAFLEVKDNKIKIIAKITEDQWVEKVLGDFSVQKDDANASPIREDREGGINLNSAAMDMQIERDGNGVALPVWDQPIESMNIEGLIPVIINVVPVSYQMLLGFVDQKDAFPDTACPDDDSGNANCIGRVEPVAKLDEEAIL